MLMEYRHLTETLQDLHDTNSILLHVVGFIIQFDQEHEEYCLGFDLRKSLWNLCSLRGILQDLHDTNSI